MKKSPPRKWVRLIKRAVIALLPYGVIMFWRRSCIRESFYSKKIFKSYYHAKPLTGGQRARIKTQSQKLIYMADGRVGAGGLGDRFAGITSLYSFAREFEVDFKINFTNPVALTHYLVPNKYDWTINPDDIIYDSNISVIYGFYTNVYYRDAGTKIRKLLRHYSQLHILTNAGYADTEYADIFNFLFKPAPELQTLIDYNLEQSGGDFISVTFRFQALLGDFFEGDYPVLPPAERTALINRCVEHLLEIRQENPGKKILVTSESATFLQIAQKFDFVYVIPGKVAHIDFSPEAGKDVYMKSFVDYFMLTHSKKVYLVVDGQMYKSHFAYRASLHNSSYHIKRYNCSGNYPIA